jgi:MFS family permease
VSARKPALGFIFVTLFLDVLGIGLIIPILPKLIEQLSGGNVASAAHTFGWLAALYSLMQFVFAPVLGSLSDRFGRRAVILASLLGSGLDYLLLAFAPSLPWFFLGRIVAGITGANIAAANAYIADVSPPEKRAANFGLVAAAFGLGFIAGPALGGVLGNIGLRVPRSFPRWASSLASLAGILGPVLATSLFGFFISDRAPVPVPGAAFFFSSVLFLFALLLALRSFRKNPAMQTASPSATLPVAE